MKIKASLDAVKSRKDVSDNVIYTAVFTLYPGHMEAAEIATMMTFYKVPLEIEVKEVQG